METDDDHIVNSNRDYTSVSVEDEDQIFANSIDGKLVTAVSLLSGKCCIFRVPVVLRRLNEKVYEPDIVAIGPYHSNKESLKPVEDMKKGYLKTLLLRTKMTMVSLIKGIMGFETRARECYEEPIDVDKNEFMEMMIMAGCFLIEFFRKRADSSLRSSDDPILSMACKRQYIEHDLLLLENQLPWFILQNLFNLTMRNDRRNVSLIKLVLDFFCICPFSGSYEGRTRFNMENLHILDLLRGELVSSYDDTDQTESSTSTEGEKELRIPCVTRLLEAGVKFKKGSGCILNIKFKNGIFEIPPLLVQETTEPLFRNLIAFEQCSHECRTKITSYAVLMDNLIDAGKEVEYLVENEIIGNYLGAEDASKFFNRLYNDTHLPNFYYAKLFKSVNEHYRTKWHRWRATLMRQYFTSPWTIISLISAIILLVLTFLQTFYPIKQSYF